MHGVHLEDERSQVAGADGSTYLLVVIDGS
jgi:hypothetical protein